MKIARFYCERIEQGQALLEKDQSHHLARVLRLPAGSVVELFDGRGAIGKAVVKNIHPGRVTVEIEELKKQPNRLKGRIIIAASVAKGHRFDRLVAQCTELGVNHVIAVAFERMVKQAAGAATQERYRKIMIDSARQCQCAFMPILTGPLRLAESIKLVRKDYPDCRILFGGFGRNAKNISQMKFDDRDAAAFVGPEGAMTQDEEDMLKAAGAEEIKLCNNVLRVETAALAFASVLCAFRNG